MKPNIVFMLADQWRLQALGYAGNEQVQTPNIDQLAEESANFTHAVSGWPVCCPWRGSFLTGQYPTTHGIVVNDVTLQSDYVGLGTAFKEGGYDTAYIGKWHIDGNGRSNYIPPERRLGFDYFKALECTHDYNNSPYYAGNSDEKLYWDGYDVFAQTADAQAYIQGHSQENPYLLVLSWGPPHDPYETAPEPFKSMYAPDQIALRPNVPDDMSEKAREWIAGYYAHCSAIDKSVADILQTLRETGQLDNTIVVFASDHGDMLGSQGNERKQRPWEESIRVPFLLRHPHKAGQMVNAMLNSYDIMPTLLSLCNLPIPNTVEGRDFSGVLDGGDDPSDGAALLACFHPFGEFTVANGGREYRGVRTHRYTYVRSLDGPWLLYDNEHDPYQLSNVVNDPAYAEMQNQLDTRLDELLRGVGDDFEHGSAYINRWQYPQDETGTVPFTL